MRRWIGYRAARVLHRFIADENYRNAALVRLAKPVNLFQADNFTRPDRYPHLFHLAARLIGDAPDQHILSFGCSTGEEVFALRAYFPSATIKGVDINRHNIAICHRRLAGRPDPAISFATAGSAADERAETYDAIFCMAVFRHGALGDTVTESCRDLIRFKDFDGATRDLARVLKPGGLLVIGASNFRFCDTEAYRDFEVVDATHHLAAPARTPSYDRDDRLIPGFVDREVAFRKRTAAPAQDARWRRSKG